MRFTCPVNKPVRFIMTSEDVLHDFFVPDMRVKHDIVPGRYTEVWFTPDRLGQHHVTCAEYCGKGHSDMNGETDGRQRRRFREVDGDRRRRMEELHARTTGARCSASGKAARPANRSTAPKGKGPSWKGIWGKMEKMNDGKS